MTRLFWQPIGTLLKCVEEDRVDEPLNHAVMLDELVVVVAQTKHGGDLWPSYTTIMLSLDTGVVYHSEYASDCFYAKMCSYEVYEP